MKKTLQILALAMVCTFSSQAQKKHPKQHGQEFTAEQKANLAIKKMTLALDLTPKQQAQIRPILEKQVAQRMHPRKRAVKKPEMSSEERYKKMEQRLDAKITLMRQMKTILNPEQLQKFKKMQSKKGRKMKKGKRILKKRETLK